MFSLRILLDLEVDASCILQSEMPHLIIVVSWKHIICSPTTHYGITSLMHVFTTPLSKNGCQASSIWYYQDAYLKLVLLNLNDDHRLMSSSHGIYVISLWMHTWRRLVDVGAYSSSIPGNGARQQSWYLIRLKCIYNFGCSMLVYTPFALCFVTLHGVFMHFPELTY
jgi:hypothetical protein